MIAEIIRGIVAALLGFLAARFDKAKSDQALQDAAVSKAEAATEEVITEIADERSQVVTGGSAADIAQRLRSRKSDGSGSAGSV